MLSTKQTYERTEFTEWPVCVGVDIRREDYSPTDNSPQKRKLKKSKLPLPSGGQFGGIVSGRIVQLRDIPYAMRASSL